MFEDVGAPDPWMTNLTASSGGGGLASAAAASPSLSLPPLPEIHALLGGASSSINPMNLNPNAILNATTTSVPDYAALMNQYIGPYQSIADQQMSALQSQIDAERGFAQKAYNINAAGYSEAHVDALRNIINNLASRGLLNSGDRGWLKSKENRRYGRQTSLAQNTLNQYFAGLAASLTNAQLSSAANLAAMRLSLAPQLAAEFPVTVTNPFRDLIGS